MNQDASDPKKKTKYFAINENTIKNTLIELTGVAQGATNYFFWKEVDSDNYGLTIKKMYSNDEGKKKPATLVWKATW